MADASRPDQSGQSRERALTAASERVGSARRSALLATCGWIEAEGTDDEVHAREAMDRADHEVTAACAPRAGRSRINDRARTPRTSSRTPGWRQGTVGGNDGGATWSEHRPSIISWRTPRMRRRKLDRACGLRTGSAERSPARARMTVIMTAVVTVMMTVIGPAACRGRPARPISGRRVSQCGGCGQSRRGRRYRGNAGLSRRRLPAATSPPSRRAGERLSAGSVEIGPIPAVRSKAASLPRASGSCHSQAVDDIRRDVPTFRAAGVDLAVGLCGSASVSGALRSSASTAGVNCAAALGPRRGSRTAEGGWEKATQGRSSRRWASADGTCYASREQSAANNNQWRHFVLSSPSITLLQCKASPGLPRSFRSTPGAVSQQLRVLEEQLGNQARHARRPADPFDRGR